MKNIFKKINLKIVYKVLTYLLITFYIIFSILFVFEYVSKKYLYPLKHTESITYYATEYNLNVYTLFALIKTESNFNETSVSNKGAIGVMQITPTTANYIANF
ncbi:MAG: transglycosylase SLT domain-containing protein, partial [Clostridia bacterium]|nr:transglycosylase SLT domain-containing protein [Clostridia bacterium]